MLCNLQLSSSRRRVISSMRGHPEIESYIPRNGLAGLEVGRAVWSRKTTAKLELDNVAMASTISEANQTCCEGITMILLDAVISSRT